MLELGLDTLCYHRLLLSGDMSVEDVVDASAALGVGWLRIQRAHLGGDESLARLETLGRRARSHRLRLIWSGDSLGQASWPNGESLERIHTGIEQAVATGSPLLRMFPSWFRSDALGAGTLAQELTYLRDVLCAAVPVLEQSRITLAVENHSNVTASEMTQLIMAANSPFVRVHLDLVNPIAVFEDPIAATRRMAPYAAACDVKDLVMDSDWATDRYHRTGFRVRYTWPGDGIFPLTEALTALREASGNADLPIIVEGLDETEQPTEKAQRSLAVLRHLTV